MLMKYQILNDLPQGVPIVNSTQFLTPGRQIHIRSKINMCVFNGP